MRPRVSSPRSAYADEDVNSPPFLPQHAPLRDAVHKPIPQRSLRERTERWDREMENEYCRHRLFLQSTSTANE